MEVLFHLDRMTMSLNKKVNSEYHNSNDFLSSLSLDENLVLHGEIKREIVVQQTDITNILTNTFGDYVLQICQEKRKIFISSSSASLNFLRDGNLHSEEEILKIMKYNDEYLNEVKILGISYASKQNMFTDKVVSLLPGSIIILNNNNDCVHSASWFDIYENNVAIFSLAKMSISIRNYFKGKTCTLLTSGGVDTALLLYNLKGLNSVDFVSYRFDTTGGNNTPEDAKNLLSMIYGGYNYDHSVYETKKFKSTSKRLCLPDVDEHLCSIRNLTEKEHCVVSGQNSDGIIAPGFVKGESLVSYFKNWGIVGAFKSLLVNFLLYAYQSRLIRGPVSLIIMVLNPLVLILISRQFELSSWGFYAGLQSSIPFLIKKTECAQLRKNYNKLKKYYAGEDTESYAFIIYLRQYTYCLAAIQNQRGTTTSGYRYVLPFQSAQFIGYSVNRRLGLKDIVSPKHELISYISSVVPDLTWKFYHRNELSHRD
ncbi:hypothetical protein OAI87_02010 [Paracoccaceae bacterium]|nr:hypothetical protein [Paracoccaceae bacterium]